MKILISAVLISLVIAGSQLNDEALIDKIIAAMTLEQKIGQTTQVDFFDLNDEQGKTQYQKIKELNLGSVLVGGNGCPDTEGNIQAADCHQATNDVWNIVATNSLAQQIEVTYQDQDEGEEPHDVTVGIQVLLGTDAVHGNQHAVGEILFPHNIGLAASFNPQNFANSAKWNKESVKESGFNFIFSPTVAVSHNPQWGRFYETMGQNPDLIKEYAKAYVLASQDIDVDGNINGVLTSVKHFLGDGATTNGVEEGNSIVTDDSLDIFIQHNIQGYVGAVEAKTGNIMISYDAINDVPMSIHPYINSELKNKDKLNFEGFVISDYDSVIKTATQGLPTTNITMSIQEAYAASFNNGVDMQMLSSNAAGYQTLIKNLVEDEKTISQERLDDAVKRILLVKHKMGLIQVPTPVAKKYNIKERKPKEILKDKDQENSDALQAALQSLVLLQNKNTILPLDKTKVKHIILLGDRYVQVAGGKQQMFQDYDNIGAQNGGWSIRWQGYNGNDYWKDELKVQSKASSVLDAIKARYPEANIYYPKYEDPTNFDQILADRNTFRNTLIEKLTQFTAENVVIINVLAENPYAEFMGDINSPYCQTQDQKGCLYNSHTNEYQPSKQATTLEIQILAYEKSIINLVKGKSQSIPVITVLFSGRPMIINQPLSLSTTFIAAWLPGTTGGEAVVKSIFGEYLFGTNDANKLPFDWFTSMDQLYFYPFYYDNKVPTIDEPKYAYEYGLKTQNRTQTFLE